MTKPEPCLSCATFWRSLLPRCLSCGSQLLRARAGGESLGDTADAMMMYDAPQSYPAAAPMQVVP